MHPGSSALVRARHRRTPLRMIARELFVRLEAKAGREEEVESFLRADVLAGNVDVAALEPQPQ